MLTLLCTAAVVALLVVHEYLALRAKSADAGRLGGRRLALLGLVACAIALGAAGQLASKPESELGDSSPESLAFYGPGDPFLRGALDRQRPERPFPEQATPDQVYSWQAHVREILSSRSDYGSITSDRVTIRTVSTDDLGDVRRTLLEYVSWDGTRIPAYLHQPVRAARLPAILVVPGHGAGIRATAGVGVADYQSTLALQLARHGYVTLTPELRGFGLLGSNTPAAHSIVANAALEAGSFYKAVVGRDLKLALSVLQQWNGVDPDRIAVAGTSLGGELAVFLGVLDPRVRVVIAHSYGGVTGPTTLREGANADRAPHGCHTIPGSNRILHQEDWFRLLAPRPVQVVRGSENSRDLGPTAVFRAAVSDPFERLGAPDRFEYSIEPGGHQFFLEPAVRFLAKWL